MAAAAAAAADGDATSAVVAENNASMSIGKVPHGRRESLRLWNDGNDWIRKPHREKVNEEHCVMSLSVKRSFTILPVFSELAFMFWAASLDLWRRARAPLSAPYLSVDVLRRLAQQGP